MTNHYEKAAGHGSADALFSLGCIYYNGWGVKKDYVKAMYWYEKGIEKGDAKSKCELGILFANVEGVKQDYSKARSLWEDAARQGNSKAIRLLEKLNKRI